ncbi:MAG: MFS transporter [Actinomycetota bacterium]|nr:MFS transporter [Actinomycetota bacterium]
MVGTNTNERSAVRQALASRDFRLLLTGMAVSEAGSWLYGVALLVLVFDQTQSAGWVAAATILRTIPYVVLGPLGGLVADRYDRRRVMVVGDLTRAALMVMLAMAAAASMPVAIAIALAFLTAAAGTPYGPAVAALTPSVVKERALAGANATMGTVEHTALIVGPAIGGLLLILGSPSLAFVVNAFTFVFSAGCIVLIRTPSGGGETSERSSMLRRLGEGVSAVTSSPQVSVVIGFVFVASFLYGHELVLLVFVSERLLGTGSEGVGFLNAAIGAGGVLAAGLTSRLAASRHPRRMLTFGILASALPLAALAVLSAPWMAYLSMAIIGAGSISFEVVSMTLLQRGLARDVLARVFGMLDSLGIGGVMLGSLVAPFLVGGIGLRGTLVLVGVSLPVLVVALTPTLRRFEERAVTRADELSPIVDVLDGLAVFSGAPRQALEAVAEEAHRETVPAGTIVVQEGQPADDFFVVLDGSLDVSSIGEGEREAAPLGSMGRGDHFGEIGLLEDLPRTATVVATTDCDLLRVPGDSFLAAVNQEPTLSGTLIDGIVGRLSRTHPTYRPKVLAEEAR